MVRPSSSSQAARPSRAARRALHAPTPQDRAAGVPEAPEAATETTTAPRLLLVFLASLLLPVNFAVAGVGFTPSRVFLLVMVVPLAWRILRDPGNRVTAADLLILGYVGWTSLAIMANHGASRLPFIVSSAVDLFGGYVVGRALVRNAADYRLLFRYFVWALIALAPFALVELLTRRNIIFDVVNIFARAPNPAGESARLGLFRVQTVFEHYILFGLFCSMGFANVYYIHLERLRSSLPRLALVGGLTFTALSSAPVISIGLQGLLTIWDRVMRFLPGKWPVLILVAGGGFAVVQLGYPGGLLALVIDNLSFDPSTGWGRMEILEYGSAEVVRHPVFGIGMNEWVRPWWRKVSIDNFWLLTAVRFGLPALLLLWLAIAANALGALRRGDLGTAETRMRTGYLIGWTGLAFTLGTVHIWGEVSIFVMTYIGAGAWFYARAEVPVPARERRRRATAARLEGPQPAGAAPPAAAAGAGPARVPGARRPITAVRRTGAGR